MNLTKHQRVTKIIWHCTSASVDFPSCRTYQHLLPSCQNGWVVSPPNGLSVHPVFHGQNSKKQLDEEVLWCCPPNTPRKRSWLSTIRPNPQKGWCFSSHPETCGNISIVNPLDSNHSPYTSAAIAAARAASRESYTWSSAVPTVWKTLELSAWSPAPKTPIPNTDGNRNTEMLNRRPTVGLFRPALSSGKNTPKLRWNAGKFLRFFLAMTNAPTNPNN